ncbi:MAG: MBL fold metallo-hydrolase, partial [Kiritimatiellales bacterium]
MKNGFSNRFSLKSPHRLVLTESPTDFFPGVSATGTVPRAYNTDAANRNCYLDEAASVPDRFVDDQAVLIETLAGTVVLVGCCRAGLANIMEYVADLTGRRSIYAIIGGLHLEHAATDTMENVLDMLFEFNVQMLGMAHCTGAEAEAVLRTKFSRHSFGISVGSRIRI